jgi:hypothetical protein
MSDDNNGDGGMSDLKAEGSFGSRDDESDPYRDQRQQAEQADDEAVDPLEDMVDSLTEIRDGDGTLSIGCRDDTFAAYLNHLQAHPERMEAVAEELRNKLEHPPNVDTSQKASIIRLLLRVGLQEGASDEYELIGDANAEYAKRNP